MVRNYSQLTETDRLEPMLYIVSTPIGNLKDITFRAIETLKNVALIAAEDTRHTKILLDHYGIEKPLTSFFEHNQNNKTAYLIGLLKEGKDIALVSDAGTPGICDPGYPLIDAARRENIPMTVIPGPTAFVSALTLSGLPTHEFMFVGFLPVKSGARLKKLQELAEANRTVIAYESPHRLLKTLEDLKKVMPQREITIARELTKMFEEITQGTPAQVQESYAKRKIQGEIVLLF